MISLVGDPVAFEKERSAAQLSRLRRDVATVTSVFLEIAQQSSGDWITETLNQVLYHHRC